MLILINQIESVRYILNKQNSLNIMYMEKLKIIFQKRMKTR